MYNVWFFLLCISSTTEVYWTKKNVSLAGIEPTISGLEGHALPVEPRAQSLMIIVDLKMDVFQIVPK